MLTFSKEAAIAHNGITYSDYQDLSWEDQYDLDNNIVNISGTPKQLTGADRYSVNCVCKRKEV